MIMNITTLCVNCKQNNSCTMCWKKSNKKCPHFIQITNADRIRAMNDDELAGFIKNIKVRAVFCKAVENNDAFDELCSAEWLQQPFEGE